MATKARVPETERYWLRVLGTLNEAQARVFVAQALLRGDGGVHPAVLHHAMRRTETEIVHMIGNIEPAMDDARRNDQHVTDLQLDFACANRHAAAAARTVRSAVRIVRAAPAVDDLAIDERDAAAGDD